MLSNIRPVEIGRILDIKDNIISVSGLRGAFCGELVYNVNTSLRRALIGLNFRRLRVAFCLFFVIVLLIWITDSYTVFSSFFEIKVYNAAEIMD